MATDLADAIFKCIFLISLKSVPRSTIDDKAALVQVIACRRFGTKPLPESIMSQFIEAYMRHKGCMS